MTAYSEQFNPRNHDYFFPGDSPEIEQLGDKILELAVEDLTDRNSSIVSEGRYRRSYSGTMSDVLISARVYDAAIDSGNFSPEARYSLLLSALLLAESDDDDSADLTAQSSRVHELESIEISGTPFEQVFAPLRPESEHWPTLESPHPIVTYTLNGDYLDVPELDTNQRRLAAVALAQAFVVKYGINKLTPADNVGAFWPDGDPLAKKVLSGNADDAFYGEFDDDDDDFGPEEPLPTIEDEEVLLAHHPDEPFRG